jgi:hypothetical protein
MSRQQILDFQARWMRPAGIAAILGAALLVVSGVVGSVGSPDDTAEQLELYQDHAGRYVLASVISGVGLVLLTFPLYFVFRSALARSDRVRGFLGPLFVIGAVLVAVQGVLFSVGLKDASDRYVAGVSAVEAKARQDAAQAQQPQANPPAKDGKVARRGGGAGGRPRPPPPPRRRRRPRPPPAPPSRGRSISASPMPRTTSPRTRSTTRATSQPPG